MTKAVKLLLPAIIFSIGVFAQNDVKWDDNVLSPYSSATKLTRSLDKGKIIESGISFTKSFYGEKALQKRYSWGMQKKQLSKTFEVVVEQDGKYFFAAHILPANNVDKINTERTVDKITVDKIDILEVRVYLNEQFIGTLNQTKLDWELVPLNAVETVDLQTGKNTFRFESDIPYYPMVDAVRITRSAKDLIIENTGYNAFIAQLKSASSRILPNKKESQKEIDRHPKNALNGTSYGSIFAYYRDAAKDPYPPCYTSPLLAISHKYLIFAILFLFILPF